MVYVVILTHVNIFKIYVAMKMQYLSRDSVVVVKAVLCCPGDFDSVSIPLSEFVCLFCLLRANM